MTSALDARVLPPAVDCLVVFEDGRSRLLAAIRGRRGYAQSYDRSRVRI